GCWEILVWGDQIWNGSLHYSCCDRSTNIQSYEGGSVSISCVYNSQYRNNLKYICRGKQPSTCLQTSEGEKGRYSIHDDNKNQVFTVTISDLSSVDAGKYWCGVTRLGMDPYTAEVKLEVEPGRQIDQFQYTESSLAY
uniref:Immunoglobulin domain-containing protein n=1 Tax=Lates calcarifer TaxID=8187 RepID=A0A4W6CY25_LATCA